MHNCKELTIWLDSFEIAKVVYDYSAHIPQKEDYGLISQMRRCSVSVPSNIAEGASRSSDKNFCRFLEIVLGSSFELQTQIELSQELFKIEYAMIDELYLKLTKNQKMIRSLINKLRL
ncbi:four helix bundle protein [Parvicella tangerina]|uniref:Four helix bundle protein n=1 Tax=Parvicella tangerina TaxID=2829795 RepID=A0A916JNY5_9FLAO|nr:four helix bundle protein [Parvicella tangerina]CAG5084786.1 hypothetical protein CRYO30217_02566 [Parvicella tangerina]